MEGTTLANASAPDRSGTDFYPTPENVTRALTIYMGEMHGMRVWEPACGAGHMARALKSYGAEVTATDLFDQGYGETGVDFLTADLPAGTQAIITNPPFRLAEEFIRRCLSHRVPFALLLKSQYWHSARRLALFHERTPQAVLPLTWRPDFHFGAKGGSPTMEVIWTVWGATRSAATLYLPQARP